MNTEDPLFILKKAVDSIQQPTNNRLNAFKVRIPQNPSKIVLPSFRELINSIPKNQPSISPSRYRIVKHPNINIRVEQLGCVCVFCRDGKTRAINNKAL